MSEVSPAATGSLSLDQFALNLIRQTITTERVAAVMSRIAGDCIEVGPLRFGPGGAVAATGVGRIGLIEVVPALGGGFQSTIPGQLSIDLTAGSGGHHHRYDGEVEVRLSIRIVLLPPACVVLDVAPVRAGDVTVRLQTSGVATFVLQTLGDADREVAAQVARVVNERVAAVEHLRRIDLAAMLDRAWCRELEDGLFADP